MESIDVLVSEVRAGNLRAYGVVVGQYQKTAIAYAYSILRDHQLAEDVVQEAFVKLWRNIRSCNCISLRVLRRDAINCAKTSDQGGRLLS